MFVFSEMLETFRALGCEIDDTSATGEIYVCAPENADAPFPFHMFGPGWYRANVVPEEDVRGVCDRIGVKFDALVAKRIEIQKARRPKVGESPPAST